MQQHLLKAAQSVHGILLRATVLFCKVELAVNKAFLPPFLNILIFGGYSYFELDCEDAMKTQLLIRVICEKITKFKTCIQEVFYLFNIA